MLAFSLFTMVITLPRILGTARASVEKQSTLLGRAWSDTDLLEAAARCIAIVAVAFPILATVVILFRLLRKIIGSTWRRTRGRPVRRGLAGLVAATLVAGLAWAWWPHPGTYRPIEPYEGGTLVQAAQALPVVPRSAPTRLVEGQRGSLVTGWSDDDPRPTRSHPQLALVLIPRDSGAATATDGGVASAADGGAAAPVGGTGTGTGTTDTGTGTGTGTTDGAGAAQPWVFPFNKPLAPDAGDNQAMAVNTSDNTIRYDVAFALVWVEDDSPALNTNEAYAFASCTNCAAVAIGFQIVLVTGDNHVAVPQNISAAVNYDCVNCLTYALATQLFVTLDGPLSDTGRQQIAALWQQIADFGTHITEVPLSEVRDRLTSYEQQILDVIQQEQGPLTPDPTTAADASATPTTTAESSDGAAPSAEASPGAGTPSDPATGTTGGSTGSTGDAGSTGSTGSTTGGTSTGPDPSATPTDPPSSTEPSPSDSSSPVTTP
jgi:putative peptide zinc metalloprotease protein